MPAADIAAALFAAQNRHDADAVGTLYSPDGVHEDVGPGAVKRGPQAIADGLRRLFAAFPSCRWDCEQPIVDGERIAVPYTFSATLEAPFAGVEPRGQAVELRGVNVLGVAGGRLARSADYGDVAAFMRQLREPRGERA